MEVRVRYLGSGRWEASLPPRRRAVPGMPPVRPRRIVEAADEAGARARGERVLAREYPAWRLAAGMDTAELVAASIEHRRRGGLLTDETAADYAALAERYIDPNFKMDADRVSAPDIEALYALLLDCGRADGAGVSAATLRKVHTVLAGAFDWMCHERIIGANPARGVHPPKAAHGAKRALSEGESAALLAALRAAIEGPLPEDGGPEMRVCAFAAWTGWWLGVRVGEACAIRRRDVYFTRGRIEVCGSVSERGGLHRKLPKTAAGTRMVSPGGEYMASLAAFLAWQREEWFEEGFTPGEDTPLFCRPDGSLMRPSDVSAAFKEIAESAGVELAPGEAFHVLRHTNASYMLADGLNVEEARRRLGHARASTTLENYGHAMPGEDAAAGAAMEEITRRIGGAL